MQVFYRGFPKFRGERLQITITSMEYNGNIIPVEMSVYDTDGQRGIFIPNTKEINAAKEVAANMGTNAGTSISLSSNAGEQFAADRVFLLPEGNINNQQLTINNLFKNPILR